MSGRKAVLGVSAVLALFSLPGLAIAQEKKTGVDVQVGQGKVVVDVEGKRDRGEALRGMAHRASEIHGMIVRNEAGKELGTVKDLVINVQSGKVRYAAMSYGGFLGLGDKLFAVPWDAFEQRHDPKVGKHNLVLNINEETLKNAPGFEKSSWPNFGDPKFSDAIEKHYGRFQKNKDGSVSVDIKVGPIAVVVNGNRNPENSSNEIAKRVSQIIGMSVINKMDKDLGSVNDLMIGMDTGIVRYAALSFGGTLGFGSKLFAIPWTSFEYKHRESNDKNYLVLATDEAILRKAPGFDKSNWPNLVDPKFSEEIDAHYVITNQK